MPEPPCSELLLRASRSDDLVVAAAADNCRFDERAGAERWTAFEVLLAPNGATTWDDWAEAYRLHLEQRCNVARPTVPDAFLDANRSAWLGGLSKNQSLVRIEDLSRALQASGLDSKVSKTCCCGPIEGITTPPRQFADSSGLGTSAEMLDRRLPRFGMKCGRSWTTRTGLMRCATAWVLGTTDIQRANHTP